MKTNFLKLFLFSILFLFSHLPLCAQRPEGAVKGRILDNDGKPATAVTIELKGLKKAAVTDNNGSFVLHHLSALNDSLIISSAETKVYKQAITLKKNETIDLGIIQLHENIPQLQNVEITGRAARSYKSDYSFFGNKTQTSLINIPQSIATVTKELIMDKMAINLKEVVDGVAGVNQYSGYDEYTIRGFRAENSRDINGLRGYNTTYTNSMLVNIERVEIIKGPTATLYGNCDPGGTINLVTKKPLKNNESEIGIYGGTWHHFRALGDNTGPLNKQKTWLYRINAGYDHTQSFRNGISSASYQAAPSLSFVPNEKISFNFDFSLSHINTLLDRGQPGILNDPHLLSTPIKLSLSQPGDYLRETDIASIFSFSYKINGRLSFNTGFLNYITQQNVANHGLNNYITPDSVSLYYTRWKYLTVTNTISNYFTYRFQTGRLNHELVAGFDYIQSKVKLNQNYYELPGRFGAGSGIVATFSLLNPVYFTRPVSLYQLSGYNSDETDVDESVYHTQGVYLQNQVSLNRWKLLFGLREEFYKGDGQNLGEGIHQNVFLPRIGIVFAISGNIHAYATYNKGFDPFEPSGNRQIFSAAIKPQISSLFEGGMKGNFFSEKLFATFSIYQLTVQNVAVSANNISNPDLFIQQGQSRSRGVEIETSGNIASNLSLSISYSYCDAKITKSTMPLQIKMPLENAPLNSGSSWIKYTFTKDVLKGFSVSAGHSQASVRNTLEPGITLPGYIIINAAIQYSYKKFTLAARIENITNKIYWAGAYNNVSKWPGEPRNLMINLRCKL